MAASLTANQILALRILAQQEVPTIREVAEAGGMSRSSAQGAVTRLTRIGFAEQAGSAIRGGVTFRILPAGSQFLDEI